MRLMAEIKVLRRHSNGMEGKHKAAATACEQHIQDMRALQVRLDKAERFVPCCLSHKWSRCTGALLGMMGRFPSELEGYQERVRRYGLGICAYDPILQLGLE